MFDYEIFLNKRKNKQFSVQDVKCVLDKLGYETRLVETYCKPNNDWSGGTTKKFKNKLLDEVGMTYFAYIKFYTYSIKIYPTDDEIYALVAGKTNSWNDDIHFKYENGLEESKNVVFERSNKAKKWLVAKQREDKNYRWYHEKVLIVQLKDDDKITTDKTKENLVFSIEDDIGGLLGLFRSWLNYINKCV